MLIVKIFLLFKMIVMIDYKLCFGEVWFNLSDYFMMKIVIIVVMLFVIVEMLYKIKVLNKY